ncbi:MAG: oligosaccharide flippase family protein, partial [Cyanobacteria bacterium J06639_14]
IVVVTIGVFFFLAGSSLLGLNVYLVRQPELPENGHAQILAFYNTAGILFCALIWFLAPIVGVWADAPAVSLLLRCMVPALWFYMIANIPLAMLERDLRFVEVGIIETLSQVANYGLSIPLVLIYKSYWGPIAGFVLQFFLLAVLAYYRYPITWQWRWQGTFIKEALRHSCTFSSANGILLLRGLTVPLLVSRLAGIEAVGVVSIAIHFTDSLALLRLAIRRMSINMIAKISQNLVAMRAILGQGITFQIILVGPLLSLFACCAAWLIPLILGDKWLLSVQVFPLIAIAALIGAAFDLHASTLHAVGKNNAIIQFNLLYIAILWLVSWLTLSTLGVWGYGIAEIATLPTYFFMHYLLSKQCGSPNYKDGFWVIVATLPSLLFGPWIPAIFSFALLFAGYGLLFYFRPQIRRMLRTLFILVRSQTKQLVGAP